MAPERRSSDPETQRRVEESVLIDGYALHLARKLLADPAVKDLFVYLPGLDIVQAGSDRGPLPYRFLDLYKFWIYLRLEELDAGLMPEDRMVILALPGRAASIVRAASQRWGYVVTREPRTVPGILGAPRLTATGSMDILDIAPSLLELRGFPVSREMEGRSRADIADESRRPAPIDSYGRNSVPSIPFSSSSEEDERETLERLRSLGYLN